ncbi:hypothetical protein D3C72_2245900 [compost metagenome]
MIRAQHSRFAVIDLRQKDGLHIVLRPLVLEIERNSRRRFVIAAGLLGIGRVQRLVNILGGRGQQLIDLGDNIVVDGVLRYKVETDT